MTCIARLKKMKEAKEGEGGKAAAAVVVVAAVNQQRKKKKKKKKKPHNGCKLHLRLAL